MSACQIGRDICLSRRIYCVSIAVRGDDADPALDAVIADFNATLARWYPGIDPKTAFPAGSPLASFIPALPSLASVTTQFATETDLQEYIKNRDYDMGGYTVVRIGDAMCFLGSLS